MHLFGFDGQAFHHAVDSLHADHLFGEQFELVTSRDDRVQFVLFAWRQDKVNERVEANALVLRFEAVFRIERESENLATRANRFGLLFLYVTRNVLERLFNGSKIALQRSQVGDRVGEPLSNGRGAVSGDRPVRFDRLNLAVNLISLGSQVFQPVSRV